MSFQFSMLVLASVFAAFVLLRFTMFPPRNKADEPGPHNNWRRDRKASDESSFHESGSGMTGGDH